MRWLLLRSVILVPIVLAVAALILLVIGLHAAYGKVFRRHLCTANS